VIEIAILFTSPATNIPVRGRGNFKRKFKGNKSRWFSVRSQIYQVRSVQIQNRLGPFGQISLVNSWKNTADMSA